MTRRTVLLGALAAGLAGLILCFYTWTVTSNSTGRQPLFWDHQEDYYNLLADGFRQGHLYLDLAPDPLLLRAANPFDPAQRAGAKIPHDISFYRGHYYIYYGVTPVVVTRLPWRLITGHDLPQNYAILFWVSGGFLAASALFLSLRRRYFPEAGTVTLLAGLAVLGLASATHAVLRRTSLWEEPIAAGYCCCMVALLCLWRSLHSRRPAAWFGAAGLALGLAVGARPTYLFGTVLALPALLWAWRRGRAAGGRWPDRAWWRQALAFGAGLGVVLAALAWYNYARFGDVREFGGSHQFTNPYGTERAQFSLRFAGFNAYLYFLAPLRWSRYFPFVEPIRVPPLPAGYFGSEYVYGLLANFPFAGFALLAPLAWRRRPPEERALVRTAAGIVALCFAGVLAVLLCFVAAVTRYMVDFTPALMLLACIGMLGAERAAVGKVRRAVRLLAGTAAAFSVFTGVMMNFQLHELLRQLNPGLHRRIAHAFDRPAAWAERLAGTRYGPIELTLRFPRGRAGRVEPLVVTGWGNYSDYFLVYYIDDHHLKFGFDHAGHGLVWSPPVGIDLGAAHRLVLQMGSLFPPRAHPFFDGLAPAAVEDATRWLRVSLDGRLVFGVRQDFYDSSPGQNRIGGDPGRAAYGARFTGEILQVRRGVAPPAASGAAELDLSFPPGISGRSLPLVATGRRGRGDLLSIRFGRPGIARFRYDHWGEVFESAEVRVGDGPHRLEISMPSLLPPGATAEAAALRRSLRLRLDGRMAWAQVVPFFPAEPAEIYLGENGIGASSCEAEFAGELTQVLRTPEPDAAPAAPGGPLRLWLRLPRGRSGHSEPLVVSGATGRGDLLSVRYVDGGHVRFALDHWNGSFHESDPVQIDYDRVHEVVIQLPAPPGSVAAGAGQFAGELMIRVDGRVAWRQQVELYAAAAGTLEIAANRIGGSSCEEAFTGGIAAIGMSDGEEPARP